MKLIKLYFYITVNTLVPSIFGNNTNLSNTNPRTGLKENNEVLHANSILDLTSQDPSGIQYTRKLLNKKKTNFCHLNASISCKDKSTNLDCSQIPAFNTAQCQSNQDYSYDIVYTAIYKNKNTNGAIQFYQKNNPNNNKEYTFAKSNMIEIDIQKESILKPGKKRVYKTTRTIDPCNLNVKYYIGETILHGKVKGKKGSKYQCRGYDFYKADILTYNEPLPTNVPSSAPSGLGGLDMMPPPSNGKGKGKGKGSEKKMIRGRRV